MKMPAAAADGLRADQDGLTALLELARLSLHVGALGRAERYACRAIEAAGAHGSAADRAAARLVLSSARYLAGRLDEMGDLLREAQSLLDAPAEPASAVLQAEMLDGLGRQAEARSDWAAAVRDHGEALRISRSAGDTRGVIRALHASSRSYLALHDYQTAEAQLGEADRLAIGHGESLERARLLHTGAEWAVQAEDWPVADGIESGVLNAVRRCCAGFETARACLLLARIHAATGNERNAIMHGAIGRSLTQRHGFGLLTRVDPEAAFEYGPRIAAGLIGASLGAALDHSPEDDLFAEQAAAWLAAQAPAEDLFCLVSAAGPALLDALHTVGDLLEILVSGPRPPGMATVRGMLTAALAVGWSTPPDAVQQRRQLTTDLCHITLSTPEELTAAQVTAACASWAIEGASPELLAEIAAEEAEIAVGESGASPGLGSLLGGGSSGPGPAAGEVVTPDAYRIVGGALRCLDESSPRAVLDRAAGQEGAPAAVAAVAGGLFCCRHRPDGLSPLPDGLARSLFPDVGSLSEGLAARRIAATWPGSDSS